MQGPKGELTRSFLPVVQLSQEAGVLLVAKSEESRLAMQQHGLTRTLASNMVVGVSDGFSKTQELIGTGYRASVAGKELTLNLGYCKPRILPIPEGLKVAVSPPRMARLSAPMRHSHRRFDEKGLCRLRRIRPSRSRGLTRWSLAISAPLSGGKGHLSPTRARVFATPERSSSSRRAR